MKVFLAYVTSLVLLVFSNLTAAAPQLAVYSDDQQGVRWLFFSIENAKELYGIDFELEFDPKAVTIVDADPKASGSQIQLGQLFVENSYELSNRVDFRTGNIRLAASVLNPAPAINGSGELAVIGFKLSSDSSVLKVKRLQGGSVDGNVININVPETIELLAATSKVDNAATAAGYQPAQRQNATLVNAQPTEQNTLLLVLIAALLVIILLLLIIVLRGRSPKAA